MYRIDYEHGSHTVTPNHQVTLRWNVNPQVAVSEEAILLRWRDPTQPARDTHLYLPFADGALECDHSAPCVLPRMSACAGRSFGHWLMRRLHASNHIRVLMRGHLFEVTADELVRLRANKYFAQHAVMPLADAAIETILTSTPKQTEPTDHETSCNPDQQLNIDVECVGGDLADSYGAFLPAGLVSELVSRYLRECSSAPCEPAPTPTPTLSHTRARQYAVCADETQMVDEQHGEGRPAIKYVQVEHQVSAEYVYLVSTAQAQSHQQDVRPISLLFHLPPILMFFSLCLLL